MTDRPRLIEVAFPLKEASIDSVHEKNVRHGHISTLHIWPARRPLAASRAALIATLLPDPGNDDERKNLLAKIGGKVVKKVENKKVGGKIVETTKEETQGGVLHWGRESEPDMDWFREEIRKAYGGRAPRVLDPFAGGGAIPLEAMRLGCDVTAMDINPVAWFILKCTLEYPQKLSGKKLPLPAFAMELPAFKKAWEDAQVKGGKKKPSRQKAGTIGMFESEVPEADLAWHVRAWGHWVLEQARKDLERFYPLVDGKAAVAYLWARTVRCKDCNATIPLLKTRWLCKKDDKKIVLTMAPRPDRKAVVFAVKELKGKDAADKTVGAGTMSRSGAQCPCCPAIMTMGDIRAEGQAGRLGAVMTAVVVDGPKGKEYRSPTDQDVNAADDARSEIARIFADIPFGMIDEPTPKGGSGASRAFSVDGYGFDKWSKLFTPRQLAALGTFVKHIRDSRERMRGAGYPSAWIEALNACMAMGLDRVADRSSSQCRPDPTPTQSGVINTFSRFALPIYWDFIEGVTVATSSGGFLSCLEWVALAAQHLCGAGRQQPAPLALNKSAIESNAENFDVILTDPPYYDAIPYSDLMDFFYVWLRRVTHGLSTETDAAFSQPLGPKWDSTRKDGELIDDASRFGGDKQASKRNYEEGMGRVFQSCHRALVVTGRLVVVFAHKHPDAWETLVSAIIRAGFVVDGSWPIQTEMANRTRALSSAALSSSVWLVCKKRPETARPGWDNRVLDDMRERIAKRLRDFWDAGIRGPDFVWAATGPALEAYSKYPIVKKANEQGQVMTVSEFLRHVRRIVVDFVVGRVLTGNGTAEAVSGLDDLTTYYLLHRHDFGMNEAPAGACILYAVSCGLSDRDLSDRCDLLTRTGGKSSSSAAKEESDDEDGETDEESDDEGDGDTGGGSGNKVKLKPWDQRRGKTLGQDMEGKPAPLIDQVHRLMGLWTAGDVAKVNEYLDTRALWKNQLFHQLLQALIELAPAGSDERARMESISNHVSPRNQTAQKQQREMFT